MNRRSFVHKAGLSTVALAGAASALRLRTAEPPPIPSPLKNWIWTGLEERSTRDQQQRRFESYRASGIQAVLFSGVNEQVFATAKEQGLETHAWTWTLCRGDRDLLDLKSEAEFDEAVRCALAGGAKGVSLFGGLRKIQRTEPRAGV